MNYKVHFKILAVVFSAVGLLVIIFDKQFDMLLLKKKASFSSENYCCVCTSAFTWLHLGNVFIPA